MRAAATSRRNPTLAHDGAEGARQLGAGRHDPARDQAGHRRGRGRHLRGGHLRGLRAERRRGVRAGAHRQPQPHAARDQEHLQPQRRVVRRAGRGVVAVRAQGHRASSTRPPPPRTTSCSPPLDAGAEDIEDIGDTWQVTTPPTELHAVRTALEEAGIAVTSADLTMLPTTTVALDGASRRRSRCCGSSTRSRTTTTCRTCTRTSTSPTTCSQAVIGERRSEWTSTQAPRVHPEQPSRGAARRSAPTGARRCRPCACAVDDDGRVDREHAGDRDAR